jgi:transcriptional regulator with XRE-family HTH domain
LVFEGVDSNGVPKKRPSPSTERKQFGRAVARLRDAADLTQEQLAEMIDVSPRHLQAIEAGDYWPTLPTLKKMRHALCVGWKELCEDW